MWYDAQKCEHHPNLSWHEIKVQKESGTETAMWTTSSYFLPYFLGEIYILNACRGKASCTVKELGLQQSLKGWRQRMLVLKRMRMVLKNCDCLPCGSRLWFIFRMSDLEFKVEITREVVFGFSFFRSESVKFSLSFLFLYNFEYYTQLTKYWLYPMLHNTFIASFFYTQ